MPQVEKKTWHTALGTSCGTPDELLLQSFSNVTVSTTSLAFRLFRVHFICTSCAEASADTSPLCLFGAAAKNNLVLIFPQICRWEEWSPAASTLAQWICWHRPNTEHPPPLFPRPWECNTLLTKSHFPFLSNFHTPATLPPPTPGWHGDWGVTCLWLFPSPLLFPSFPWVFLLQLFPA